jgi:hypothetical protein
VSGKRCFLLKSRTVLCSAKCNSPTKLLQARKNIQEI